MAKGALQPAGSLGSKNGQGGLGMGNNALALQTGYGSDDRRPEFPEQPDPQQMPNRFSAQHGISGPSGLSAGQGMSQDPRDLDPGVTRGTAIGAPPSPGLSQAPNSAAARSLANKPKEQETEGVWNQIGRTLGLVRPGDEESIDTAKPTGDGGVIDLRKIAADNGLHGRIAGHAEAEPRRGDDSALSDEDWLDMLSGDDSGD